MTATHYVTAKTLTPDVLLRIWRSLSVEQQEDIGVKTLAPILADCVAEDDGLIASETERSEASGLSQNGCQAVGEAVQAALPWIFWYYPDEYTYELRDNADRHLGTVEWVKNGYHRYRDAMPSSKPRRKVLGSPVDCLPAEAKRIIADGGWFGVMLPDGRRYPNDFSPLDVMQFTPLFLAGSCSDPQVSTPMTPTLPLRL